VRGRAGLSVVVTLTLAGEARGAGEGDATADDVPAPTVGTTAESSPFVVKDPPAGYQLVPAGRATTPRNGRRTASAPPPVLVDLLDAAGRPLPCP
jgi:hypothetical protein